MLNQTAFVVANQASFNLCFPEIPLSELSSCHLVASILSQCFKTSQSLLPFSYRCIIIKLHTHAIFNLLALFGNGILHSSFPCAICMREHALQKTAAPYSRVLHIPLILPQLATVFPNALFTSFFQKSR